MGRTYNPQKRHQRTLELIGEFISPQERILDLGVENTLSRQMKEKGYNVMNTQGEDLDDEYAHLRNIEADVVTAFEILEHLLNPYSVLKNLPGKKLLATVPLNLWFASPARDVNRNQREWHYHEFTDWQFDMLLKKSGWDIKYRKKWVGKTGQIGFRPFLRNFTPRFYVIFAERKSG